MKATPIEINGDLVLSMAASVSATLNDEQNEFRYYCDLTEKESLAKCAKANQKTLLHDYIAAVCCEGFTYIMCKHFDEEAAAEMIMWLDSLQIDHTDIAKPHENSDYCEMEHYADLIQERFNDKALPIITDAVFAILFNDKDFLYKFNCKVTEQIKKLRKEEFPEYLQGDGYLNRENPPAWLKCGVFYRDRGRCQECGTDLSRIFANGNNENYDHIIPLRQGGSNDPSNYQLMCEHCNKSKRDRSSAYRNVVWPFWDSE